MTAMSRAERRARVVELTNQGLSAPTIAQIMGCSKRAVQRNRRKGGVGAPIVAPMTEEELAWARNLLDEGASIDDVARTLGRSWHAIRRHFPGRGGWTRAQMAAYRSMKCQLEALP